MILNADARAIPLMDSSVQCVVTSPPYWGLRDYGNGDAGIGLEESPDAWVGQMVDVFREIRRVLKSDGTVWLNVGDAYASSPPGNTKTGVEKWASSGLHGAVSARYAETLDASVSTRRDTRAPGLKAKDLIGLPWRLAFALQADGWYLRADIIWSKPNPMPESVTDRPTKAHEYVFLLTKSPRYYYDADAVRTAPSTETKLLSYETMDWKRRDKYRTTDRQRGHGRRHAGFNDRWDNMTRVEQMAKGANLRSVWHIPTKPFPEAHFATFPPNLVIPCILAGTKEGDTVLDPFAGAGTALLVSRKLRRRWVGLEVNPDYCRMAAARIEREAPPCLFDLDDEDEYGDRPLPENAVLLASTVLSERSADTNTADKGDG